MQVKNLLLADDDECAGAESGPRQAASRRSALTCGERCDRMTHQAMPFTLCWFRSPHTEWRNPQACEISVRTNHVLSIAGQSGKSASPPHPEPGIQYADTRLLHATQAFSFLQTHHMKYPSRLSSPHCYSARSNLVSNRMNTFWLYQRISTEAPGLETYVLLRIAWSFQPLPGC